MMTVRELAAQLGLGKSTVADALRGKAGVSPETRARVLQRARELGYESNPLTSALLRQVRAHASPRVHANVALLLDSPESRRYMSLMLVSRGFRDRAKECGLVVDELNTRGHTSKEVMRILISRGIEGVAILPLRKPMGRRTLDWSKFAAVSYGYSMVRPRLHRVVHNSIQGIRTAFRMCRKKGFRRIGLALEQWSHIRSNGLWMAGFLEIQQLLPKTEQVSPLLLPDGGFTMDRIGQWIGSERPDVAIIHGRGLDETILAGLLKQANPVVPVVLDNWVGSSFAGIDQEYERMGAALADQLVRQLVQNERGIPEHPNLTMLEGTWIDHATLDAASTRSG